MPLKIRYILMLLAIGMAVALPAACQQNAPPAPDDGAAEVSYDSLEVDSLGLSLEYPEGWVAHEAFSGLTLASSQEVIDSASLADIGDEAFVNIIPGELAVFSMQAGEEFNSERPAEVLAYYRALLENEGQTYAVRRPPEIRTVNGQNVAQMTVESDVDGERLVTIFSVILNDEFMAIASAGALNERFDNVQPILTHILDSIVVDPPAQ